MGKWLVYTLLFIFSSISAAVEPMVIKYNRHIEASRETRNIYKHELIKLILEETKAEYGDYRLEPYINVDPGVKRNALLLSEGEKLNVMWNSPGSVVANANVIPIPIDILKGLLGYRICLINNTGGAAFKAVSNLNSLQHIRLGQDSGWSDFDIYTFNNITPVSTPTLDGLLGMLSFNRFDCLPLGALEISDVLNEKKAQMPLLSIEKTLLIYYDFPTYFFVSKKFPLLAERFKKGLQAVQKNGKFDELFNRYYQHKFDDLNMQNRHVVCLKTPYLPLENQCKNIEKILLAIRQN